MKCINVCFDQWNISKNIVINDIFHLKYFIGSSLLKMQWDIVKSLKHLNIYQDFLLQSKVQSFVSYSLIQACQSILYRNSLINISKCIQIKQTVLKGIRNPLITYTQTSDCLLPQTSSDNRHSNRWLIILHI